MKRRTIIKGLGTGPPVLIAGCLGNTPIFSNPDDSEPESSFQVPEDAITPTPSTGEEPSPNCGPANLPLSALFTTDVGDPMYCKDDAAPSLAVENQRDETLSLAVTFNEIDFSKTYTLVPGERIIEQNAFLADPKAGTVTIDGGDDYAVAWPERSCYRHGIALTSSGIRIGWVAPLQEPGDTQHDCYSGDTAGIWIRTVDDAYTITVTITELCSQTTFRDTLELAADEREMIHEELRNGGMYDITVAVEAGGSDTYEFYEECWGVAIVIESADAEISQMSIG